MARTISNSYTITQNITATSENPVYVTGAINIAGATPGLDASVNATVTVSGTVRSVGAGVRLRAGGTVTDTGTIASAGLGDAVQFYAGFANRMVVDPGAVLAGTVDGGNTIGAATQSTLELAQGTGSAIGTITDFGSGFVNFAQLAIDANSTWWLAGNNSIANGVTLTAVGTLVDDGTITNAGSINGAVEVYTGATLVNVATASIYSPVDAVLFEGPSTFTNDGAIASVYAPLQFDQGGTFTNAASGVLTITGTGGLGVQFDQAGSADNAGLITNPGTGYGIHFNGAGTVGNEAGATIAAHALGIGIVGAGSVSNAGAITSAGYGIVLKDGGSVTNLSTGLIQGGIYNAIEVLAAAGSIGNAGTIANSASSDSAIYFNHGGIVTNTGRIASTYHAIDAVEAGVTVNNAGTITNSNIDFSAIALDAGGSVTNGVAGVITGLYHAIYTAGGGTVINAGSIGVTGPQTIAIDMAGGAPNRVAVLPGAVFGGQVQGGNFIGSPTVSVLELLADTVEGEPVPGTLGGIGSSFVNFGSIQFDPGAQWTIAGVEAGPVGGLAGGEQITGFVPGDTIVLTGVTASATALSNGTLSLSDGHNLLFPGTTYTFTQFSTTNTGGNTDITVACFRAGARVLTDQGEVPAEALRSGMRVVSLTDRRPVAVRWVGTRTLARAPVVRIAAGAFGPGAPHRTLHLSPDHAVFVDGALVPVRYLVNGASIAEMNGADVTYVHVELTAHAVLVAEGLPAESYLDTGNRAAFDAVSEPAAAASA